LDFIDRSTPDSDESRKLLVALARESLSDIPADGIRRVVDLRSQLEISRKGMLLRQLEDLLSKLVRQLPDDQFSEVTCDGHVGALSMSDARARSMT